MGSRFRTRSGTCTSGVRRPCASTEARNRRSPHANGWDRRAMFVNFFLELRRARVPVSLREYLTLLEAMGKGIADYSVDDFYYLSRSCLVKDETNLDRFDRVFAHIFKGLAPPEEGEPVEIPAEWLRKLADRALTDEEKALVESLGGR